VTIGNQELKAGSYAIFTKPGADSWEVFFYTDTNGGGTPSVWDETKVAAKTTAQVYKMEVPIETFTMSIDDLTDNSAILGMLWSNIYVGVKFDVPTDKAVTTSIDKVMKGPDANDYFAAAVYY